MTPRLPNPFDDMFAAAPTDQTAAAADPAPSYAPAAAANLPDLDGAIAELQAAAGVMSDAPPRGARSLQEALLRFADQVGDIVIDLRREAIEAA